MSELNASARASYRIARERALRSVGPIVVAEGNDLVLLRGSERASGVIRDGVYHDEKALAHLALALEALVGDVDGPLDAERLGALDALRRDARGALASFSARGYPTAANERAKAIVASFVRVVDAAIAARAVRHEEYVRAARAVGPLLLANADDAARAELDAIHALVTKWRASMTPDEWSRFHVVVMGAHMARDESLELQYFERLLGEPGEGRRIVFAENVFDEAKALDLLATHVLDARLGTSYFGDPARMHRDLLSDAAKAYVPTLLPLPAPSAPPPAAPR